MERKRKSSGRAINSSAGAASNSSVEDGPAKRPKAAPAAPCIQYTDVTAASFRIRKGVRETPLKVRDVILRRELSV